MKIKSGFIRRRKSKAEEETRRERNCLSRQEGNRPNRSRQERSRQGARRRRVSPAWFFLAPSLTGICIFVLIPFADAVRRSFFDSRGTKFLGLEVYEGILGNQAFRLAAYNTVRFMAVALPLLMAVSFALSLLVYEFSRKRSFFKTILVLPVAVPAASVVLLWRMVFCDQGMFNGIFHLTTDWIHGPRSFEVLVFAYLWKNTGYQMLLWLAALAGIPDSLYEAAAADGAGPFQKLIYITLPQVKGAAGMILFLAVVNSFKVFREAYTVAGSYPDEGIYMLQHLFNHWYLNLDVQKMSGAAVLLTAAIAVPLLIAVSRKKEE